MTNGEQANLETVRAYLGALQAGEVGDSLKRFFSEDVRQIELPNRLNPLGQESDLSSMLKRSEQGRKILSKQCYEIVSEIALGCRAAVEARWTGVLAVPLGTLSAGSEMKAHFAMFFEFKEGKIASQRNYDCFEPW